ncbi:hypothetical protein FISHEDRAFT_48182 [Fistulina hepatica ATCC 64428]|uniref:ISWI chromatin-remodeling complex ATPase ISW2 n=1 Tax=Fistulina hepatica ATCC 64428 TaxID=1128425 RepID=A0A0D7A502_9AGAR|nr:hypothetical protein FISHEDRAFT_48182 [Fistulina hepatica ATCC 64428]
MFLQAGSLSAAAAGAARAFAPSSTSIKPELSEPSTNATTLSIRRSSRLKSVSRVRSEDNAHSRKHSLAPDTKPSEKRRKTEDKKAETAALNHSREVVEKARQTWLYHHRDAFIPLLHASSTFQSRVNEVSKGAMEILKVQQKQPSLVTGGDMKDYQLEGLSFLVYMLRNGMNCILGDEMGLGKTLQTLSLFAYIKENAPYRSLTVYTYVALQVPHLVVCPLSVLSSWLHASTIYYLIWTPSLRAVRFHGSAEERRRLKESLRASNDYDVVFATYESYAADDAWFKSHRFTYCVLDEGHKIKNAESQISRKLAGIGSLYRLVLTGTPVQNNLLELWALLRWLYPTIFTDAAQKIFRDAFDLTRGSYSLSFVNDVQNLMSLIMLRRTKSVVATAVPPRDEVTVFLPMSEAQQFWSLRLLTRMDSLSLETIYKSKADQHGDLVLDEGRREVLSILENQVKHNGTTGGTTPVWTRLMNLLMQLRQVCDHPYIMPDAEPTPYTPGEHLVLSSTKFVMIDKLLKSILPTGEKVLVFSQWTGMLDYLEEFMRLRGIQYGRLDGSTSRARRTLDIKLFQSENTTFQVYLIATRAGGLGINLTKASHVIMCDSDWNPQQDLQAVARAHRIGQTKTVKVYRLIIKNSVEDQMLDRIRRKLFLSLKILGSDNASSSSDPSLKFTELINILRNGSSALDHTDALRFADFLKMDVDTILSQSRALGNMKDTRLNSELGGETKEGDAKVLEDEEKETQRLLAGVARVHSRLFDGEIIQKKVSPLSENLETPELGKRARRNRISTVGGMEYILPPSPKPSLQKKANAPPFESEDWCLYCHDGGALVCCTYCPRVFHRSCHGMSENSRIPSFISCTQHSCLTCFRKSSEVGGLLFRCRTCPQTFCEDCLPNDGWEAVGDNIPEFVVLGYQSKVCAYYIVCHLCQKDFKENPVLKQQWQKEFEQAEKKVKKLGGAS